MGRDPALARTAFNTGKANDTRSKTHNPISPKPRIRTNGKQQSVRINKEIWKLIITFPWISKSYVSFFFDCQITNGTTKPKKTTEEVKELA